jgi:hypothetical protein
MPERRSYHTSFTYEHKMYIFGGLDIQNGSVDTLWELDLAQVQEMDQDNNFNKNIC